MRTAENAGQGVAYMAGTSNSIRDDRISQGAESGQIRIWSILASAVKWSSGGARFPVFIWTPEAGTIQVVVAGQLRRHLMRPSHATFTLPPSGLAAE